MNNEKKVWETLELLRNDSSADNYKFYVLPMMCIAYLEDNEDCFTVPQSARWSELIRSGKDFGEKCTQALRTLSDTNDSLQDVFNLITFDDIQDATLHRLALKINQWPIKEKGGFLAEQVLYHSAKHEGKSGGEFITPPFMADLLVQLLDIQSDTSVLDFAAGSGQFLNRAADYAEQLELSAQELSPITRALAKMNAILHGHFHMDIRLGDSLRNPEFTEENGLKTFDYVLSRPPFALAGWGAEEAKNDIYGRFFYGIPPKSRGDLAFVLHALASLKETGKAALMLPQGALFRGGTEAKIRQQLIEEDMVEAVVDLPGGLLYSTSIPVTVLMLNKSKEAERHNKLLFINAGEQYEKFRTEKVISEEQRSQIIQTFRGGQEIEKYSKWVAAEQLINYSLLVHDYFEDDTVDSPIGKVQVNKQVYNQTDTIALKQVADLFRGINTPPAEKLKSDQPTHYMIELSNVKDGQIDLDSVTPVSLEDQKNVERYELRPGDIILSSRGTALKLAMVPETDKKLLLSQHFIGIRPKNGVNPAFLKIFLEGPLGQFYLINRQKGSMVTILTAKDIQDIPVPSVHEQLQNQIAEEKTKADKRYQEELEQINEIYKESYQAIYDQMNLTSSYQLI
ncbi:hypothetical protein D7Z54_29870 [Salibacterium salarium]|uniref:site-specific DNA-methyltransferase (adenine-specific) n=1 Tax=Salibacterium salarium TaxID=284579 RepID=A0A428MU82_9BACI|nr:N-6 DNA methylase [Salibacterium salarium]RSL29692.1 hypothetical protein D7Z54_29870 [Salibacterium salarium]